MRKEFTVLRFVLKILLGILSLLSRFILQILLFILRPISMVLGRSLEKVRLSITLKINLFYGVCYLFFFFLTYRLTFFLYLTTVEKNLIPKENLSSFFTLILGGVTVVFFLVFLLIGRKGVKWILSPIRKLDATIRTTDANQLHNRIDVTGTKDELKDLAKTYNHMMDRLEIFIDKQKQFVSDASHELRTPIAVIQGYANLLSRWGKDDPQVLEESVLAIKQETDNMGQLVEKLLFLARSDKNTQTVIKGEMNLSLLAEEVIKETSFIDEEHELLMTITPDIMLMADKRLIKELLRILVDNAIKYTPSGGKIEVIVKNSMQNTILAVKDNGIGIDAKHIPHLFQRFYRADSARTNNTSSSGSGLGLSIADWIVSAHDGKFYVESKLNVGSEFIIFFNKN